MSHRTHIIKKKNNNNRIRFPLVCNANNCFFGGIIDDYPYYTVNYSGQAVHHKSYHVPCAWLCNIETIDDPYKERI